MKPAVLKLTISAILALSLLLAVRPETQALAATTCLDLALVLTVDSSASVSSEEFLLQQKGIAAAFRDPEVLKAISAAGQVAVSVIFWASEGLPKPQSGWMQMDGREGAEVFARQVESMPRRISGDTGLGAGLMAALQKFDTLNTCANRKVINISGDGEETRAYRRPRKSLAPSQVKELAEARGVEINALAISNEEKDLQSYYTQSVISGPGAFVVEVRTYRDVADAFRRKLVREISPRQTSDNSANTRKLLPVN